MSDKQTKTVTTEQMKEILAGETRMSAATREAIVTGVATFDDGRGNVYRAPPTFEGNGATHQLRAYVDPVRSFGTEPSDLN